MYIVHLLDFQLILGKMDWSAELQMVSADGISYIYVIHNFILLI